MKKVSIFTALFLALNMTGCIAVSASHDTNYSTKDSYNNKFGNGSKQASNELGVKNEAMKKKLFTLRKAIEFACEKDPQIKAIFEQKLATLMRDIESDPDIKFAFVDIKNLKELLDTAKLLDSNVVAYANVYQKENSFPQKSKSNFQNELTFRIEPMKMLQTETLQSNKRLLVKVDHKTSFRKIYISQKQQLIQTDSAANDTHNEYIDVEHFITVTVQMRSSEANSALAPSPTYKRVIQLPAFVTKVCSKDFKPVDRMK